MDISFPLTRPVDLIHYLTRLGRIGRPIAAMARFVEARLGFTAGRGTVEYPSQSCILRPSGVLGTSGVLGPSGLLRPF